MNRKLLAVGLSAAFVLAGGASAPAAGPDAERDTIIGRFALRVRAALVQPLTPDAVSARPVVIPFAGRGRANAQRSVVVEIGPLTSPVGQAQAKIELDPLQRFGPRGNRFRGRGVAVVVVGPRTYRFRLGVCGRMYRTPIGAEMVARFHAITTSNLPPFFCGAFRGPMIAPTAAAEKAE